MTSVLTILLLLASGAAALLILLSTDWRWTIAGLAIQYLVAFLLVTRVWPLGLSAIKLVSGWLTCVLLSMSASPALFEEGFISVRPARFFRLFSSFFILMIVLAVAPGMNAWLPIPFDHLLIGLLLIGMGILQMGFSQMHFRIMLGLLSLLIGFEILYAPLEGSALLAAILASITLALGLIGSTILRRGLLQGDV
jgi:hypothetical protein